MFKKFHLGEKKISPAVSGPARGSLDFPPQLGGECRRREKFENFDMSQETPPAAETGLEFFTTDTLIDELVKRHQTAVLILATNMEGPEDPPRVLYKGNLLRCHAGLLIAASTLAGYTNPVAQWIETPQEHEGLIEEYLCALATRYANAAIYVRSENIKSNEEGDALKDASLDGVETFFPEPQSILGRFYEHAKEVLHNERSGIELAPPTPEPQSLEECPLGDLVTRIMESCQDMVAILQVPVLEGDPQVAVYWKLRDYYWTGETVEEVEQQILRDMGEELDL